MSPTPAPMTAERLEEIRKRVGPNAICAYAAGDCFVDELLQEVTNLRWIKASYERDIEQRAKWASEQSAHIDALTTRVAELEQRARSAEERMRLYREQSVTANGLVGKLESELAAARKVEDGEVEALQKRLAVELALGWAGSEMAIMDTARAMSDLLTRLSAALKEARVDAGDAQAIAIEAEDHMIAANLDAANAIARAQAAEAKLELIAKGDRHD